MMGVLYSQTFDESFRITTCTHIIIVKLYRLRFSLVNPRKAKIVEKFYIELFGHHNNIMNAQECRTLTATSMHDSCT